MSDEPRFVNPGDFRHVIDSIKRPRHVRGLSICRAEPLELGWYGDLGVVVVAEDRTHLLWAVTSAIAAIPNAILSGGAGQVLNGHAFLNLVVSTPKGGPPDLRAVAARVNALKDQPVEGQQHFIDRFEVVKVSAPDRPGWVRDVCGVLAARGVNIRQFEMSTRVEFPDTENVLTALKHATSFVDLTFHTEMTRASAAGLADMRGEILALPTTGVITVD